MSRHVQLEPDGLWFYRYNSETKEYDRHEPNPDIVLTHLREECKIAEGTTLGNIFDTVEKYPFLKAFISQYSWCKHIDEFHAQAKLPPPQDELDKLTYLEVYHHVSNYKDHFDISQGFHGFGPEKPDCDFPSKDGMTHYSVSYSPMNELAHLPVKLNTQVRIYAPLRAFVDVKERLLVEAERCFSLLEVLDAIYDDISFMGGPDDNKASVEEMRETSKDIREKLERGEQVGIPLDEVLKEIEDNNEED